MTKYELLGEVLEDLQEILDVFLYEVLTDREEDEVDTAFIGGIEDKLGKYNKMRLEVTLDE